MNYHSRTPIYATRTADAAAVAYALGLFGVVLPGVPVGQITAASILGNGEYFMEYPEDIRLYGVSFATTLPTGTAWSGELSYRPNMPLQVNASDITGQMANNVIDPFVASGLNPAAALAEAGRDITSYKRKEVTQAQTTLTHLIDNVMGADRLTLVGELGITQIGGLEKLSEIRYGRAYEYPGSDAHGYHTATSWGYRTRAVLEYGNAIAGVTLRPSVAWSHDVDGYGPTFNEGSKAVSLGLDAEYLSTYTAGISYTDFFGGEYNTQIDRDFLAVTFGVNF